MQNNSLEIYLFFFLLVRSLPQRGSKRSAGADSDTVANTHTVGPLLRVVTLRRTLVHTLGAKQYSILYAQMAFCEITQRVGGGGGGAGRDGQGKSHITPRPLVWCLLKCHCRQDHTISIMYDGCECYLPLCRYVRVRQRAQQGRRGGRRKQEKSSFSNHFYSWYFHFILNEEFCIHSA